MRRFSFLLIVIREKVFHRTVEYPCSCARFINSAKTKKNAQSVWIERFLLVEHMGKRNQQIIMLMIDYDATVDQTGRFAVLLSADQGKVVFTKTFGRTLEVVLNVEAWKNGEEIPEWSKDLLLPIEARYLY